MQWYYGTHNTQFGPVEEAEIRHKLESGELQATDMVWREGMTDWAPCASVPEFAMLRAPLTSFPQPVPPAGGAAVSPYAPPQVLTSDFPVVTTSGLAVAALVMGILGLLLCQLLSIGGVICGHMALGEIKRADGRLGGRGLAIAGLATGYAGVLVFVLLGLFFLIGMIGGIRTS